MGCATLSYYTQHKKLWCKIYKADRGGIACSRSIAEVAGSNSAGLIDVPGPGVA